MPACMVAYVVARIIVSPALASAPVTEGFADGFYRELLLSRLAALDRFVRYVRERLSAWSKM